MPTVVGCCNNRGLAGWVRRGHFASVVAPPASSASPSAQELNPSDGYDREIVSPNWSNSQSHVEEGLSSCYYAMLDLPGL
ncbi:hypothetical protein FCM35_KLT06129 [Carex littledalei]|uniref:Uncharacterized protein n=1 Tax=Carex littledalei TaxID=544730 RepID=A0A833V8X1_9POAL|nr:hypothetical protein FCM35_KLT06129 [Carex littledalei]